jgi:hypothetical protein
MDSFWDFFWLMIWTFLFVAYLMVMFQIIVDLFSDRETSGGMKAVWIVCLIFLPMISAVVYLIVKGKDMGARRAAEAQQAKADADAYIRSVAGSGTSATEQIAQAKSLLDSGAIAQDEFDALKAKALR